MAARPVVAKNDEDIAAVRAGFIELTNITRQDDYDDDDTEAVPDTTLLSQSSHVINEMLLFESARSIAAARGIRLRTKEELATFMRNGMLQRATSDRHRVDDHVNMAAARIDATTARPDAEPVVTRPAPPIRVRAPKPPVVTARDRANAQFPSKRGKSTHIRHCLAAGFSLAEPPIDNDGNIAEIIKVRCVYGHVHACRSEVVLEHGLNSCHTCKCTDRIVNAVRYLLESTIGEPFTYEGDTYLHGIGVDMYVYLVKPTAGNGVAGSGKPTASAYPGKPTDPDKCRVFRHGNELHINVSHTADAPSQLIAKLRTTDHTLPGDRRLSELFAAKRTNAATARTDSKHADNAPANNTRPADAASMYFCDPTSSADVFNVRLTPSISNIFD